MWQIIHAHSLSGRFSTLACPKILAHAEHSDISPLPSQSVTARGPFLSYLLQIETFTNQPNHLSKSVTVRTVFLSYLLQIETFVDRTRSLSHSVTARQSFPQLLQIENVYCVPIDPPFDITRQPCRHRQIHAPAWDATGSLHDVVLHLGVSIHAPAWGATAAGRGRCRIRRVSIHAPAWGATLRDLLEHLARLVSIHAPA